MYREKEEGVCLKTKVCISTRLSLCSTKKISGILKYP